MLVHRSGVNNTVVFFSYFMSSRAGKRNRSRKQTLRPPTIREETDEDYLPEELKSRKVFYKGELAFTIRPDALPEIGDIVCDPYIQEAPTSDSLLRMYSCPYPGCEVSHRTENWSKLREHASDIHGLSIFKHSVANLTSEDRSQTNKCIKLRNDRRRKTRQQLLAKYQARQLQLQQQITNSSSSSHPVVPSSTYPVVEVPVVQVSTVKVPTVSVEVPKSLSSIAESESTDGSSMLPKLASQ